MGASVNTSLGVKGWDGLNVSVDGSGVGEKTSDGSNVLDAVKYSVGPNVSDGVNGSDCVNTCVAVGVGVGVGNGASVRGVGYFDLVGDRLGVGVAVGGRGVADGSVGRGRYVVTCIGGGVAIGFIVYHVGT